MDNINKEQAETELGSNILEPVYLFFSKAFKFFNEKVFESILPDVGFLLKPKVGRSARLAYFQSNCFRVKDEPNDIICIIINFVQDDFIKISLENLIHEMVHFEGKVKGIYNCSKSQFHNANFKNLAEKRGYIMKEKSKKHGWSSGVANEWLNAIFDEFLKDNPFPIKNFKFPVIEKEKKERTLFSYFCPECGVIVKGKRDLSLICGECKVNFEFIEPKEKTLEDQLKDLI